MDGRRTCVVRGREVVINGDPQSLMELRVAMQRVVGLPRHARIRAFVFT
jgi:hypothetical protein